MHDDLDFEPVPGIPGALPPGERVLWRGSPEWRALARRPFPALAATIWFLALGLWAAVEAGGAAASLAGGAGTGGVALAAAAALLRTLAFGAVGVALLVLLAWLTARETIYTVTDRRVLMRIGIALPITVNLPFKALDGVALRAARGARAGDVTLALAPGARAGYAVLWPHARPWRLRRPEPMLRALADAEAVAALLARAMARAHAEDGAELTVTPDAPARAAARQTPPRSPVAARTAATPPRRSSLGEGLPARAAP